MYVKRDYLLRGNFGSFHNGLFGDKCAPILYVIVAIRHPAD